MTKITNVSTRLFRLPLSEILSDAKHGDHTHFELITATVTLEDGRAGTGYSYTGGWVVQSGIQISLRKNANTVRNDSPTISKKRRNTPNLPSSR